MKRIIGRRAAPTGACRAVAALDAGLEFQSLAHFLARGRAKGGHYSCKWRFRTLVPKPRAHVRFMPGASRCLRSNGPLSRLFVRTSALASFRPRPPKTARGGRGLAHNWCTHLLLECMCSRMSSRTRAWSSPSRMTLSASPDCEKRRPWCAPQQISPAFQPADRRRRIALGPSRSSARTWRGLQSRGKSGDRAPDLECREALSAPWSPSSGWRQVKLRSQRLLNQAWAVRSSTQTATRPVADRTRSGARSPCR